MAQKPLTSSASSKGRHVRLEGSYLLIEFPYDPDIVNAVRGIPRRRWNKKEKHWSCDIRFLPEVIGVLSPFGFRIPEEVTARLDAIRDSRKKADEREKQRAQEEKRAQEAFRKSREEMAFVPSHDAKLTRLIKKAGVYCVISERTEFGYTVIGHMAPDRVVIDALKQVRRSIDAGDRLEFLLRYIFRINAEAKRSRSYYSTAVTRYGKKEHLIHEACRLASKQSRFTWGWKEDPNPPPNGADWVVYFEADGKQVSFHTLERGAGPEFPGEWNGIVNQRFPWSDSLEPREDEERRTTACTM